jgi:signal transduction histidine kinase
MVNQLLTFARKQMITPEVLNLKKVVEKIISMLHRIIGEEIDLQWEPIKDLWPVKMDPSQVEQILVDLCTNAKDAITQNGKITIQTNMATFDQTYCLDHQGYMFGDFVLLSVSDNGRGMDKKTLDNLFEPFFTTKEIGKGVGLGLATIYGIVKQNKGFIDVHSKLGQGSTFNIYLPRYVLETDKAIADKKLEKTIHQKKETIQLVEE